MHSIYIGTSDQVKWYYYNASAIGNTSSSPMEQAKQHTCHYLGDTRIEGCRLCKNVPICSDSDTSDSESESAPEKKTVEITTIDPPYSTWSLEALIKFGLFTTQPDSPTKSEIETHQCSSDCTSSTDCNSDTDIYSPPSSPFYTPGS